MVCVRLIKVMLWLYLFLKLKEDIYIDDTSRSILPE